MPHPNHLIAEYLRLVAGFSLNFKQNNNKNAERNKTKIKEDKIVNFSHQR